MDRGCAGGGEGGRVVPMPLMLLVLLHLAGPFAAAEPSVESLLCRRVENVKLEPRGHSSAISLTLASGELNAAAEPCTLRISAPDAYGLSLRLIDAEDSFIDFGKLSPPKWSGKRKSDKSIGDKKNKTNPDCMLNVYYIDEHESATIPVWKTTPCSSDFSIRKSPPSLMSQPIKIEWWPPIRPHHTDNLRLIVTAVNSEKTCLEDDQITCLRPGLEPLLCVSSALACDGVKHCPAGGGDDESKELCEAKPTRWIEELIKRIASKHSEYLGIEMLTTRPVNVSTSKSVVEIVKDGKPRKGLSALDAALEPYGTWGYLMLGMLICATVLLIFGVWECFCHYSRQHPEQGMPPDCVAPAAIICSSSPQHWRPYPPPTYDELEPPPPSYNVLFPSSNKINSIDDNSDELQSTSTAITNDDVNSASVSSEGNTVNVPNVEVSTNNSDITISIDT